MRDNTPFPLSLTRSVRDKALLPLSFHRRSKDNLRPSRQLRPSAVPAEPLRREVGSGARPGHPNSRGCPTPRAPNSLGAPTSVVPRLPWRLNYPGNHRRSSPSRMSIRTKCCPWGFSGVPPPGVVNQIRESRVIAGTSSAAWSCFPKIVYGSGVQREVIC